MTHDYKRIGTIDLFAAMNVATGEVLTDLRKRPHRPFFLERYAQAYRPELDAFAESVRTGGPCSPSFDDGVAALFLADAAAESAITGKSVAINS